MQIEIDPDLLSPERDAVKRRPDAIHLDWGQMGRGMTIAAPYSARACPGAPVSMPVGWAEFFAKYNVRTVPELLRERGDAWGGALTTIGRTRSPGKNGPR